MPHCRGALKTPFSPGPPGLLFACEMWQTLRPMRTWKHRLSNKDTLAKTADCLECGRSVRIVFSRANSGWRCLYGKREHSGPGAKEQAERRKLMDFCCDICTATKDLRADHNHKTGASRGTLCNNCNLAIGLLGDSPERAAAASKYLKEWSS